MKDDEAEDSEEFYQELEEEELVALKKHVRSRKGARNSRSNSKTDSLYKEALMDSIFGRFQEASRKLKLMITLTPDTPEPYHLLGTMHEQNGELDKAAEYLFMSTYLSPPNLEKWLKVGDLSFERKMFNQAAYCFGRALKIASCDPKIMVRRAEAFQLAGQSKKAITTYKRLLGISQAPQYIKKYAKLRYRRGEYSLCRQILESLQKFKSDSQLIFMACETYLKQNEYQEAAKLLQQHLQLREETMQQNQQLLPEFIVILLICSVALNRDCYGFKTEALLQETKQCYEDDYAELYGEALNHLSKFDEEIAFSLIYFLLKYPQHQSVTNYLLVTDYLCKLKDNKCLSILEQALKRYPHSPELLAQRDYIYNCFGIGRTMKQPEAIFYSDDDEPLPVTNNVYQKRLITEAADPQMMEKLIQNVEESLRRLAEQIFKGNLPGLKEQETVMDGLELFISLAPNYNKEQEIEEKDGLYIKKVSKRRANDGQSKVSVMNDNIEVVIKYFQSLISYLQGLLALKQWRKLIQVGEKVSKVHVFKNHSKLTDFNTLKIRIYQMCVLSCLAVNKFSTAMFFLRYLVTKHPEDELYVLAMHLLMRICPKKTFISSALSKRLNNPGGEHLAKLLAIEYMETGCFDLAISAILRSSQAGPSLGPAPQLCLASCLIQIASSRNTYNKLDFTNRSAICLASYESVIKQKWQALFNRGRWFAQVRLNHKAISCFERVLNSQAEISIKERAAYCLISIYRDCQQFTKADYISEKYFPLPEGGGEALETDLNLQGDRSLIV